MENGETVVDSERIALRLEELYPEPTIFPPGLRGLHLALARYIDTRGRRCGVSRRGARRAGIFSPPGRRARGDVAAYPRAQIWRWFRRSDGPRTGGELENRGGGPGAIRGATRRGSREHFSPAGSGSRIFRFMGSFISLPLSGELKLPESMPQSARFLWPDGSHLGRARTACCSDYANSANARFRKRLKSAPVESSATSHSEGVRPSTKI